MSRRARTCGQGGRLIVLSALAAAACATACRRGGPAPPDLATPAAGPSTARRAVLAEPGPDGDTGWWPSVRLDRGGGAHVAYCDAHLGDVHYLYRPHVAAPWRDTVVASRGAVGKYLALAVDAAGRPHLAYYDQDNFYLRYATPTGAPGSTAAAWHDEPVAWGREVGMAGTLAVTATGQVHLFYYLPAGSFVHAWRAADGWHKAPLAPAAGIYSARTAAIPVGPGDAVQVAYVDWRPRHPALHLVTLPGGDAAIAADRVTDVDDPGWQAQILPGEVPTVVHSAGLTRRIAVTRFPEPTADAPEPAPVTRRLVAHGGHFAAALAGGGLVLAYQDITEPAHPRVVLAREPAAAGAAWPQWIIDDGPAVGEAIDLAVGDDGQVLVIYRAGRPSRLMLYEPRWGSRGLR